MSIPTRFFASTVAAAALLASCTDYGTSVTSSASASIDGSAWSPSTVTASHAASILVVSGTDSQNRTIIITVPSLTGTGTFSFGLGQTSTCQVLVGTQSWTTALASGGGSVTLTAYSSTSASGTFTCTCPANTSSGSTGTKAVSSGTFVAYY